MSSYISKSRNDATQSARYQGSLAALRDSGRGYVSPKPNVPSDPVAAKAYRDMAAAVSVVGSGYVTKNEPRPQTEAMKAVEAFGQGYVKAPEVNTPERQALKDFYSSFVSR